jgi:CubicO group peptidase (beta-lactamase class C family)
VRGDHDAGACGNGDDLVHRRRSSVATAGLVVEKVSGRSLASFIEQNILKPQGTTRTVFAAGAEFPWPHAHRYFKMPDGKVVDATDWNPSWGLAAGNMISTLDDMRVWVQMWRYPANSESILRHNYNISTSLTCSFRQSALSSQTRH